MLSPCSWPWDVFRNLGVVIVLRNIKINNFVLIKMFVLIKIYLNKPKPTIMAIIFLVFFLDTFILALKKVKVK